MIADDQSLSRLMAAAQHGDRAAYTTLLTESKRWLERFFVRRVPAEERDDLIQDVLIAIHHKRASYDPTRAYLPWLAAIARFKWVDHLRRVYRTKHKELEEGDAVAEASDDVVLARISLERLFEKLNPNQLQVIELVKLEGCSIAEAAVRSGQSEALVKVNIHRGLKRLSALIEKAE